MAMARSDVQDLGRQEASRGYSSGAAKLIQFSDQGKPSEPHCEFHVITICPRCCAGFASDSCKDHIGSARGSGILESINEITTWASVERNDELFKIQDVIEGSGSRGRDVLDFDVLAASEFFNEGALIR